MSDFYTAQKDALTHASIVHELLKKIVVDLSTHEFRGGYQKPITNNGVTYLDYVPDSRAEYIQAVEALADILLPQFDESMTKEYSEYEEALEEIEKELEGKDIKVGDESHLKFIRSKLKLIRILFQRLNLLLKRTNYLKIAAYSEEDIAEDEDEDDYEEWKI